MFLLLTLKMWFPVGKLSSVLLVMSPFFFSFNPSIPIPDKKKKINLNFLFLRSGVTKSFIKALMTKKCKHKNLTFILIQISEMHGVGGSIHSFLRIIL